MNYAKISRLNKAYFSYRDISRAFGISLASGRVAAARLVKSGDIIRVRRDLYILTQKWVSYSPEEKFVIANLAQSPSYISLMTALSYYEITTQIQRDFIESVVYYRTKLIEVGGTGFNYSKINRGLYFGFVKLRGFFIACPEKAFLDAIYFKSLKKYNFDLTSIDRDKLNVNMIASLAAKYPAPVKQLLLKYGYVKETRIV